MALNDAQKQEFAEAVAAFVPEQMLASVVKDHDVVKDFDKISKSFAGPVASRYAWVARTVIDTYDKVTLFDLLAEDLYQLMKWQPQFVTIVVPLLRTDDRAGQQAFFVQSDNVFVLQDLEDALRENKPRICCIAGSYQIGPRPFTPLGTGFLVGPDLVLTARHVFEPLIDVQPGLAPDSFMMFFDHMKGEPIVGPDDQRSGVRRVKLAANWLVVDRASLAGDGRIGQPNEVQIAAMLNNLDFALVRLAEEVGLETISPSGGGARRSWVSLPPPGGTANLRADRRIVIPQHPFGFQQSLDFGRFKKVYGSGTRILYDTQTGQGSSGAPCFNLKFRLVGVHNAEYNPLGLPKAEANQAILFDVIDPIVRPLIGAPPQVAPQPAPPPGPGPAALPGPGVPPPPGGPAAPSHLEPVASAKPAPPTRLWKLSEGADNTGVIIGRVIFLNWLAASQSPAVSDRAERIYVAVAPARGAGKTFTIEILAFSLAKEANCKTLVLGTDQDLLPTNLGDLVGVLATKLNVPATELRDMPPRPDADLPAGSVDGDKLRRWASVLVPSWFAGVLERNRVMSTDRAEEARKRIKQVTELNRGVPKESKVKVSKEIKALAASKIAIPAQQENWRLAWIAIDNLSDATVTSEIKDFLAAMAGAGRDEAALPDALRRLRWLYLGSRPDFLGEAEATVETLDPANVTEADVQNLLRSAFAARGREPDDKALAQFSEVILLAAAKLNASGVDIAVRMRELQDFAGMILPRFLPKENG